MEQLTGERDFDVIVVGSGPAGIAAGLSCRMNGYNVLLITGTKNKALLRDTVESIHPGVMTLLKQINCDNIPSDSILGSYDSISNGIETKSLNPYSNEIWKGLHISKSKFNKHLLAQAHSQNLEILSDTSVIDIIMRNNRVCGVITKDGRHYFAKYIIDASGSRTFIARKLNFKLKYYSQHFIVLTGTSSSISKLNSASTCSYFLPQKKGWIWFAQLYDKSFYWTKLVVKDTSKICLKKELESFENPVLHASADMRWRIYRPICTEGAALCGDAAFLIDPAGGQGILNAALHGIEVSNVVKSCMDNAKLETFFLAQYDNWLLSEFENKKNQLMSTYEELGITERTE